MFIVRALWSKIFGLARSAKTASNKNGFTRSLSLESLEDRRVLSVSPTQISLSNSNLTINGSDAADIAIVTDAANGMINVRLESEGESVSLSFNKSQVQTIFFYGKQGDDRFTNSTNIVTTAFGDEGNDILTGGSGDNDLYGGDGDDSLIGNAGNDRLIGHTGSDSLTGGDGDDALSGGDGNDTLGGGIGDDVISGNKGDDQLWGDEGDDQLLGDEGSDLLFGDEGHDVLWGGNDGDRLTGGEGDDQLYGGSGKDFLSGELGIDSLWGGTEDDNLYGGDGDDRLIGDAGNDRLLGQGGNDSLAGGDGNDALSGGDGNDTLGGGIGDDVISGNKGDDQLLGEEGSDVLFGDEGNDSIWGGDGNDTLYGGDDNDLLDGGEGNDVLMGGQSNDTLDGGAGNDILVGGMGSDSLIGSGGDDLLIGGHVDYDLAALKLLLSRWTSGESYAARVAAIEDHYFAAYLQSEETVFDDYVADTLTGGLDDDWFFVTGTASVYDPNMGSYELSGGQQAHSSGGHDGVNVVDHIPVLEGFNLIDSLDHIKGLAANESVHTLVPHADDESKRREHLSLFELVRYDQVTHYAVSSGNWSDSSTWHDGIVPAANARVLIPIGVEVTIDKLLAPEIATIRVDGTLSFATHVNTWLKVDTIVVSNVGSLEMGTADDPIAGYVNARLTFTNNGAIDRNWDPFGISRGLITHGSVEMHGAAKTSSLEVDYPVTAGTAVLRLASIPENWRVGDKVVIAGTTPGMEQNEERIIRAMYYNVVVVDPLVYDHLAPSGQNVHIANLTRNIIIDSEGTAVERRGHVMFMHNKDVHINYAGFYKLGRTNKAEFINDPEVDANWNLVPGTGTNPRARYAVHFHRTGTLMSGTPATVNGSVVEDNLGWGFVNHSSYVDFTNNAAYDIFGSAFVTEVGDETGSFRGNIAIGIRGSGEKLINRNAIEDHGHTGDGFWFQGAGVTVVNNVAANAEGSAFIYFTRPLTFGGEPIPYLSANLPDPSIANGASEIAVEFVPVREFSGNVGYASETGVMLRYNLRDASHEAQSVLKDSVFWNNNIGVNVPYSENVVLDNLTILHGFNELGAFGVAANGESKDITYNNLYVSGYVIGIDTARKGYSIVNGGSFATRYGVVVRPAAEPGSTVRVQGNFRMLPLPSSIPQWQVEVDMRFDTMTLNGLYDAPIDHLFNSSATILNYGQYDNQRIYFAVQAANAIPFPEAEPQIPNEYVGLTTLQLRNQYGLTVGGGLAPAQSVTVPGLKGLLSLLL